MTTDEKLDALNIHKENARVLAKRRELSDKQRKIVIAEIASLLADTLPSRSPKEIWGEFNKAIDNLSGEEKIIFCREFVATKERMHALQSIIHDSAESIAPAGSHGKMAYVKNTYNSSAFDSFAAHISHAKSVVAPSFSASCEKVADGECEFCILPTENSEDGKLLAFYSLIDRYDLQICAVCDIEDEQSRTVRYALLRKELPETQEKNRQREYILEFSIISENGDFLTDMLSATNECRAELVSFDFLPMQYDINLKKYLFLFKLNFEDALPLIAFLALNYHNYTPVGFYPNAE